MKIKKSQLRRLIQEVMTTPTWVEDHFAWRNVVFTRDGEVRYINDTDSPETKKASEELGEPIPASANVLVVMGANPGAKSVWMHDSELLDLIDREGWHERPPPEGADPEGFWNGKGEWHTPYRGDDWDLPPDLDLPPAAEGKMIIRKSVLRRIMREIFEEEAKHLKESDYQRVHLDPGVMQAMFEYLIAKGVDKEEMQRYEQVNGQLQKLDTPRPYDPPRIDRWSGYTSTARDALEAGAEDNGWSEDQVRKMHTHLNNMID